VQRQREEDASDDPAMVAARRRAVDAWSALAPEAKTWAREREAERVQRKEAPSQSAASLGLSEASLAKLLASEVGGFEDGLRPDAEGMFAKAHGWEEEGEAEEEPAESAGEEANEALHPVAMALGKVFAKVAGHGIARTLMS
jgi:hypothetical protein